MLNPNKGKNTNVPTSDTGTASRGISVDRQPCRKRYTTATTSTMAIRRVSTISLIPSLHGAGGIHRNREIHVVRKTLLGLGHQLFHTGGCI